MRADNILAPAQLFEMAFRKRKVEQIVTSLERPINYHLLKLLAFDAAEETRAHWRVEVTNWLRQIAVIKIKPDNKPIPQHLVYEWLYDEPFGGSEVSNTAMMLGFLEEDGLIRNGVSAEDVAVRLRLIHVQIAERIAHNNPGNDIIAGL
jgi:hypothetical protein